MEGARRTALALGLAGLAVVANVAGAALYADAAPYVGFLELARSALPGLALALAAGVVAVLGRGPVVAHLLVLGSLAAAAPTLSIGLAQRSGLWVAVGAMAHLLPPVVVALAVLVPRGRFGRVALACAVVGVASALAEALVRDPGGWEWCRCVANPVAFPSSGDGWPRIADVLGAADVAVLVAGLGLLLVRRTSLALAAAYLGLVVGWVSLAEVRDLALVLLAALFAWRYAAGRPSRARVADLLLAAGEEHDPARIQSLVGRALGDPEARVVWWDAEAGRFPVAVPDRGVLRVEAEGRPVALVTADRLDEVEAGVRDSLAQALLLAAENRRLTAELQASLEQVRDSRARIVAAGDETRRRLERDLHDGAQQLLISTGIKLNLASARAGDDPALRGALDEASTELQHALAELRQLAGGIVPTALVHGDLASALHELALRSPVPTTVHVHGSGEPDEEVAATVYFVVAECLANLVKHAEASRASVDLVLGDPIRVGVCDDGRGGATLVSSGSGLRGLVDRVEARGGRLELVSGSSGTTVSASMPDVEAER